MCSEVWDCRCRIWRVGFFCSSVLMFYRVFTMGSPITSMQVGVLLDCRRWVSSCRCIAEMKIIAKELNITKRMSNGVNNTAYC